MLREDVSPVRPRTLYGTSKHATRLVASAFAAQAGVQLAWGRVFFLYGPGEQPGRLVPAIARGLLDGERVATSDGGQLRDFMHVRDVGAAFAALLDSGVEGPVNIATGAALPVRALIEAIAAEVGHPELLEWGALRRPDGDPDALVADVARLRDEVGFAPAVPLAAGVRETVEWWRGHLDG